MSARVGTGAGLAGRGAKNENIRVYLRMRPYNERELEEQQAEAATPQAKWVITNEGTAITLQ